MRKTTKRLVAIGAAAVLAVGGATAAWAYFTSTASANGTVSSAALGTATVAPQAAAGLYPGHTVVVDVLITNTSTYPVYVTGISGASTFIDNVTDPDCQANAVTITGINPSTPNANDSLGASQARWYKADVYMETWAGNGCANQPFSIPFTAALQSA